MRNTYVYIRAIGDPIKRHCHRGAVMHRIWRVSEKSAWQCVFWKEAHALSEGREKKNFFNQNRGVSFCTRQPTSCFWCFTDVLCSSSIFLLQAEHYLMPISSFPFVMIKYSHDISNCYANVHKFLVFMLTRTFGYSSYRRIWTMHELGLHVS